MTILPGITLPKPRPKSSRVSKTSISKRNCPLTYNTLISVTPLLQRRLSASLVPLMNVLFLTRSSDPWALPILVFYTIWINILTM